jgi:hypothetical protein
MQAGGIATYIPKTCRCEVTAGRPPYPVLTQRLPRAAVAAMVVGFFGVVAGARRAVTPYTGPWLRVRLRAV